MKSFTLEFAHQALAKLDAALLDPQGTLQLFPAAYYHQHFTPDEISAWAVQRARYCLPTLELVTWLKDQIADRSALEIGAGMGDLCHHLGIKGTDSYIQIHEPEVLAYYQQLNQQPTRPPAWVEKRSATAAVQHYRPQVTIGAYITHKWHPGQHYGSAYGVDEETLLRQTKTYIHIGNHETHRSKPIRALAHQEFQPPWLITRATRPQQNVIYIWS